MPDFPNQAEVEQSEHLSPANTGDNISAKRVSPYAFDGSNWQRVPLSFIDVAYDYVGFSNPDANDNYQTIVFKTGGAGGTTKRTLTLGYDASNNVTSIARA